MCEVAPLVPEEKSDLSISKTSTPCRAKSRKTAAPLIPPPIIRTETEGSLRSNSIAVCLELDLLLAIISLSFKGTVGTEVEIFSVLVQSQQGYPNSPLTLRIQLIAHKFQIRQKQLDLDLPRYMYVPVYHQHTD